MKIKFKTKPDPNEPCELRSSSTVLGETWGANPLVYSASELSINLKT
jgi:hypothetical protein